MFNPHPKSKSDIFLAVDIAQFQHGGIDQAAAQYFEPTSVFANVAAFPATNGATHVHFGAGLGKWKVRGAQPNLRVFSKQFLRWHGLRRSREAIPMERIRAIDYVQVNRPEN